MNRASISRINYSSTIFSRTYYESTIFSRTHYEFIFFFANSLSISQTTDDSIICLPNSLKIYEFTINSFSYSWIHLELTLFRESTISASWWRVIIASWWRLDYVIVKLWYIHDVIVQIINIGLNIEKIVYRHMMTQINRYSYYVTMTLCLRNILNDSYES